jgi:hypothetical protein
LRKVIDGSNLSVDDFLLPLLFAVVQLARLVDGGCQGVVFRNLKIIFLLVQQDFISVI